MNSFSDALHFVKIEKMTESNEKTRRAKNRKIRDDRERERKFRMKRKGTSTSVKRKNRSDRVSCKKKRRNGEKKELNRDSPNATLLENWSIVRCSFHSTREARLMRVGMKTQAGNNVSGTLVNFNQDKQWSNSIEKAMIITWTIFQFCSPTSKMNET